MKQQNQTTTTDEEDDLEEAFKKLGQEKGMENGIKASMPSATIHGKEEGYTIGYELGFALGVIAALSSLAPEFFEMEKKQEVEKAVKELQNCIDKVPLEVPPSISNNADRRIQLVRIRLRLLEKKLNFSLGLLTNATEESLEF